MDNIAHEFAHSFVTAQSLLFSTLDGGGARSMPGGSLMPYGAVSLTPRAAAASRCHTLWL